MLAATIWLIWSRLTSQPSQQLPRPWLTLPNGSLITLESILLSWTLWCRRTHNMCCSADVFLKNMTHFNWKIRHLSETVQGLSYNHLRGFYQCKVKNKDNTFPICWSHDGILCNAAYQENYLQHLRFAILLAATKLGCHKPCPVSHVSV